MELLGVISAYNEIDFIRGAVRNLLDICDRVVVVDGAYHDFTLDNGDHHSTDGTVEVAKSMGAMVIPAKSEPWKDQVEKRNQYLIGENGDWYLYLDADERFFGDPRPCIAECTGYGLQVRIESTNPIPMWYLRIFRHFDGIRYHGAHNAIHYGDHLVIEEQEQRAGSVWIEHFSYFRSEPRKRARAKYYAKQLTDEMNWRQTNNRP